MSHGKCTYWITILVWPDCKVFYFDLVLANWRYVIGSWNLQHMNDNKFYRFCFALMLAWLLTSKASSFLAVSRGSMIWTKVSSRSGTRLMKRFEEYCETWIKRLVEEIRVSDSKELYLDSEASTQVESEVYHVAIKYGSWKSKLQYTYAHTTYVTLKWIIHNTFWCLLSLGWRYRNCQLLVLGYGIWF